MDYQPKHSKSPFVYDEEQREFVEKLVNRYMTALPGQPASSFPDLNPRIEVIAERCRGLNEADTNMVRSATLNAVASMWSVLGYNEFLTAIVGALAAALDVRDALRAPDLSHPAAVAFPSGARSTSVDAGPTRDAEPVPAPEPER